MSSILTTIKKLLNVSESDTNFDVDITVHINSALSVLTQLGVGPTSGFSISDASEEWTDFVPENPKLEMIKSYVFLKTRIVFDPPTNSTIMEANKAAIAELEWRILNAMETTS